MLDRSISVVLGVRARPYDAVGHADRVRCDVWQSSEGGRNVDDEFSDRAVGPFVAASRGEASRPCAEATNCWVSSMWLFKSCTTQSSHGVMAFSCAAASATLPESIHSHAHTAQVDQSSSHSRTARLRGDDCCDRPRRSGEPRLVGRAEGTDCGQDKRLLAAEHAEHRPQMCAFNLDSSIATRTSVVPPNASSGARTRRRRMYGNWDAL